MIIIPCCSHLSVLAYFKNCHWIEVKQDASTKNSSKRSEFQLIMQQLIIRIILWGWTSGTATWY